MMTGLRVGDAGHTIFGPKREDGSLPATIATMRDKQYSKLCQRQPVKGQL